jgi:hypothetical protein
MILDKKYMKPYLEKRIPIIEIRKLKSIFTDQNMEVLTINASLILSVGRLFFYAAKTQNWRFRGVFRGDQDFFGSQSVLSAANGNVDYNVD